MIPHVDSEEVAWAVLRVQLLTRPFMDDDEFLMLVDVWYPQADAEQIGAWIYLQGDV